MKKNSSYASSKKAKLFTRGKKSGLHHTFSNAKYKVKRSETMFSRNSREKSENKNFISRQAVLQVLRLLLKQFSPCKNLGNPITPSPFRGIRERASAKKRSGQSKAKTEVVTRE